MIRRTHFTALKEMIGDRESYVHASKAFERVAEMREGIAQAKQTMLEQGELTPKGIADRLAKLNAPLRAELQALRDQNVRRAQGLTAPAKKPEEIPAVEAGRAARLVDLWRGSTFRDRDRLMTQTVAGQHPDLANLMVREPELFGITDTTVQILRNRITQTPQVDDMLARELTAASLLEEELAELSQELATEDPETPRKSQMDGMAQAKFIAEHGLDKFAELPA
jgi:hypothetical protein